MLRHFKYARSRYIHWLGIFSSISSTICGIIGVFNIIIVILPFVLAFIIPLLQSIYKKLFILQTTGNTDLYFKFTDLLEEDYIVITTTIYYDINPSDEYISEDSIVGKFVRKFFESNDEEIEILQQELQDTLQKNENNMPIAATYGEYIKKEVKGKIVYFLAFTDRKKTDQPKTFYIDTISTFLNGIINENHGKSIVMPLIGNNNNLSNTGFNTSEMTFKSLLTMINYFEIIEQTAQLKLTIVALPEERTNLIDTLAIYSKKN
ncbi:MAG: hypothetical protein ATN34_01880 [Epulopiscium sp. Nele67-Bin002]|nr:MAG: hypothetical protein ATN33_03120 [Epulopiscium sp. Nele67-Bin001]OON91555.1 MAG: hypothetical protein ATN34_01880 [Epulopiscium sp. Nele67-Bin002]